MPKLLSLSVSDYFAVYSRIIYFLVPPSPRLARSRRPFAPNCLHVIPDISSGRAGILSFKFDPKSVTYWECPTKLLAFYTAAL
jgi:hypothetical protein